MSFLLEIDKNLFLHINNVWGTPLLDGVMLFLTHRYTWGVFGLLLATIGVWAWRRRLLPVLVMGGVALGLADALTYQLLKPSFARDRPCHGMEEQVRLVQRKCGGDHGFPSNHAANGAAVAMVCVLFWRDRWAGVAVGTAVVVGFTRIYLGVHYPLDIIGGFGVGASLGWMVVAVFRKLPWPWSRRWFEQTPQSSESSPA